MRILAFSDLHCDLARAASLAKRSPEADLVVGAGDFASVHDGLEKTIDALSAIEIPTVLVPGNNETADALRDATSDWASATILHGESTEIDGLTFFGLGAGIPVTPWDWSFDLSDDEATAAFEDCREADVLVLHSPPKGHCDRSGSGESLGSPALTATIERIQPKLAVCGHIHESWGERSRIGATEIANLGPDGVFLDVGAG
ncbi:metallophosphoesterase family protein [soil metagenome]